MTDALVLIPWQDTDDAARKAAFREVLRHWNRDHDMAVRVSRLPRGVPWCKAEALTHGMSAARSDVVIVADADCIVDPQAVTDCVRIAAAGAPWAIPHWHVVRLTRAATGRYLRGEPVDREVEQEPYLGVATGGCVIIRTDVALSVPMDATYKEWGGEDYSWGYALDTLVGGPYRPKARTDLIHLWHPRHPRAGHGTNLSSDEDRRVKYFEAWASRNEDAMRALVEGGRVWPSPTSESNSTAQG